MANGPFEFLPEALHHISFGKPPQTQLVDSWKIISDELIALNEKFALIGYKNIKKGGLKPLWEKCNVLSAQNVLKVILSEGSLSNIRRGLKKETAVTVSSEEIIGAIRRLLNEAALAEMETTRICLPVRKPRKKMTVPKKRSTAI